MAKELWETKYRPKSVDEYIFQNEKHRELIEKFIADGYIPHLLLSGHRGTGKTSLVNVLKNELEIDDMDYLVINASDENNVDTIRNKIKNFISTFAISKFKLVFLDEADWLTNNAQAALRHMMEEYAENARFVLSCNRGHKIMDELKSRCLEISFKRMSKDDMLERLAVILSTEKIKATVDILNEIVDVAFPDMRKAVQLLQNNVKDGVLQPPSDFEPVMEANVKLVGALERKDFNEIREIVSTGLSDDDWEQLYTFLYTYLDQIENFKDSKKWRSGIVIIADHLYKHSMVADPEINAMAMFIRLCEV